MIKRLNIELVMFTRIYWDFLRELREDERVFEGFVETLKITRNQQAQYIINNGKNYLVALVDGRPSGYIGVIQDDIRI
jgi:hypothetical protein